MILDQAIELANQVYGTDKWTGAQQPVANVTNDVPKMS